MSLQSSLQIGEIIRNAVVFDMKNWLGEPMNSDSLIQTVQDLFSLLEERRVEYVLAGGVALLHYVEGRNTQDLDLLMGLTELEKVPEIKISTQDMYFVRASYDALKIDILLTQNPLFNEVHSKYSKEERFFDRQIPIATVEGLLLLKLYALPSLYREGDFVRVGIYENDIATLLHYYPTNVENLLIKLSEYVSESDLAELRNIITDLQNRANRFKS